MRWWVLGSVEFAAHGRRKTLGSGRRRAILAALLAARGGTVPQELLIETVWGCDPPPSARKSLQSHVARLRGELTADASTDEPLVVTAPGGYRLPLRDHHLDAARFEDLVSQAGERVNSRPDEAVALLEQAEALWRGAAFGELADRAGVRFEATRLDGLRQSAASQRIDALLSLGRHDEVIGELEAHLATDPLAERACAQLMLALYRDARQAEALRVFRRIRERLRDELGVDPSPAVATLYQDMLRQDGALALPAHDQVGPSADPGSVRPDRPEPGDRLLGRDEDAHEVARLLLEAPLVTLTGPGGVGKTRLAEALALDLADRFEDGVVTVRLASVRDPGGVAVAVLDALGAPQPSRRPPGDAVTAAVGDRHLLLVLDDGEHLLEPVSTLVASVVRRCTRAQVLVTSREPLRLPGERVRLVPPLMVPPADASAAQVAASPAGALFCARASAAEPRFELSEDEAPTIAALCRRLDGMPLALELAAARLRTMTATDLLDRLSDRFGLLTGGPPTDGGRHRTLQAVVDWSHSLLDGPEAMLYQRLSVFAGRFSLASAEQLCSDVELPTADVAGVLSELVDKSIVTVDRPDGTLRYRLLDTLRDDGSARLEASGEADRWRRAHVAHHLALAERLGPRMRGPDEPSAAAEIAEVADDLRMAHERSLTAGDLDGALRMPAALCDYIILRLRDEMITLTERALQLPGVAEHPAYPGALATAAVVAHLRADFGRARERANTVLAHGGRDALASVRALTALRVSAMFEGRFQDVLDLDDAAAEVTDALDDDYYRTYLGIQGVLSRLYGGDGPAALEQATALEATAEASGSPSMQAWATYCHGEALLDTDPARARSRLERSLALARRAGSYLPHGAALVSLGSLHGRLGEHDQALRSFGDAIRHWQPLGNDRHLLTTLRNLLDLLVRVGADEPAARLYGAVTPPSSARFGTEARRLDANWDQLCRRLGFATAQDLAGAGRSLTVDAAAAEALRTLADLLD